MSGQHEGSDPVERRTRRKATIVRWVTAGGRAVQFALTVCNILVTVFGDS